MEINSKNYELSTKNIVHLNMFMEMYENGFLLLVPESKINDPKPFKNMTHLNKQQVLNLLLEQSFAELQVVPKFEKFLRQKLKQEEEFFNEDHDDF